MERTCMLPPMIVCVQPNLLGRPVESVAPELDEVPHPGDIGAERPAFARRLVREARAREPLP